MRAILCTVSVVAFFLTAASRGNAQELDWVTSTGSGYSYAFSVGVDGAGNVYTAGIFRDTVDFDPGTGTAVLTSVANQGFVQKVDPSGNFVFVKGFYAATTLVIEKMHVDDAGNITLVGTNTGTMDADPGAGVYSLPGSGYANSFIIRLDSNGDLVWAGSFGRSSANSLAVDENENIYVAGSFDDLMDLDPTSPATYMIYSSNDGGNGFLTKLKYNGEFQWGRRILSSNTSFAYDVAVDPVGHVYLSGSFADSAYIPDLSLLLVADGAFDALVWKLDSAGNSLWAKTFTGASMQRPYKMVARENELVVAGTFAGTMDVDLGPGTHMLTAGTAPGEDVFMVKMDGNGNHIWSTVLEGNNLPYVNELLTDADGNIYLAGDYNGEMDLDPGTASVTITNIGGKDGYVIKTDENGDLVWYRHMGGNGILGLNDIYIANDDIYLAGYNTNTVDFDPGPLAYNISYPGSDAHAYVSKWGPGSVSVKEDAGADQGILVYPNPMEDRVNIVLPKNAIEAQVTIVNTGGQVVHQQHITADRPIVLFDPPKGVYVVMITDGDNFYTRKVVKK